MKNKFLLALILVIGSLFALCACGEKEKIPAKWTAEVDGADFVIEFAEGQDIKILQFADLQSEVWQNARTKGLERSLRESRLVNNIPDDVFLEFITEAITKNEPDLIILTGDNICGDTDDLGEQWLKLIHHLDSFKTPWLCVFGNHDSESNMGVTWQAEQLINSEYCIFAEGEVTGNCNYNVLLKQGDEYKYLFYMVDTHGENFNPTGILDDNVDADKAFPAGIYDDQLEWLENSAENIYSTIGQRLPVLIFQHIPPHESGIAVRELYPDTYDKFPFYADREGDLGWATEAHGGIDTGGKYWDIAKRIGCVGMFVGHQHEISTSIVYDGIRITYGLKSSVDSYYNPDMLGSTVINIRAADNSFDIEYVNSELGYPKRTHSNKVDS